MDRTNTSNSIQGGDVPPLPVAVIVGASSKYDKDGKAKEFPAYSRWGTFFFIFETFIFAQTENVTRQDSEEPLHCDSEVRGSMLFYLDEECRH